MNKFEKLIRDYEKLKHEYEFIFHQKRKLEKENKKLLLTIKSLNREKTKTERLYESALDELNNIEEYS